MSTRISYTSVLDDIAKKVDAGLSAQEILTWVREQSDIEQLDYAKVPLLDHGYTQPVEFWGSDQRIIESARMSTDGGFRGWGPIDRGEKVCTDCGGNAGQWENGVAHTTTWFKCATCHGTGVVRNLWPGDERLLKYLYDNKHATPFEFCGLTIEVQAPILVFREWHRHRTQSYTEMSARYTPLPDLYYVPAASRLLLSTSGGNKQASTVTGAKQLTEGVVSEFQAELKRLYSTNETLYRWALEHGIPKELARCSMPVGHYSRMRATANLRNWLAFLTLRMDEKAQWEIRQYAGVVGTFIKRQFPRTWDLFVEGVNG